MTDETRAVEKSYERRNGKKPQRIAVTRHEGTGDECLYIGTFDDGASAFTQRWNTEDGDVEGRRYHIIEVVTTPTPMTIEEGIEWVKSAPEALDDILNHDLSDDFGAFPGIGFKEFHSHDANGRASVGGGE